MGPSLDSGIYDDTEWASELAVEVVRLYLTDLHSYVTGGVPNPHWAQAFALAEDCDRSPGRIMLGQVFAHLILDFPHALVNIDTTTENTRDFYTFGNALVDATPGIVRDFKDVYGVDLDTLFTYPRACPQNRHRCGGYPEVDPIFEAFRCGFCGRRP